MCRASFLHQRPEAMQRLCRGAFQIDCQELPLCPVFSPCQMNEGAARGAGDKGFCRLVMPGQRCQPVCDCGRLWRRAAQRREPGIALALRLCLRENRCRAVDRCASLFGLFCVQSGGPNAFGHRGPEHRPRCHGQADILILSGSAIGKRLEPPIQWPGCGVPGLHARHKGIPILRIKPDRFAIAAQRKANRICPRQSCRSGSYQIRGQAEHARRFCQLLRRRQTCPEKEQNTLFDPACGDRP
jgi:hypothetical protein